MPLRIVQVYDLNAENGPPPFMIDRQSIRTARKLNVSILIMNCHIIVLSVK